MKLVIAEKPALAEDIAKAIKGIEQRKNGYISKGEYVIVSAYGHMLSLKEPKDYDRNLENWNINDLPIYFSNWGNKIDPDKKSRVLQIGELLKSAACVIHAGDPDDEGQLLVDELLRWEKYKGTVYRLNTSNTTTAGLEKALGNLKNNKQYESLGWAAYARSVCDLMVGVNMSRYYSCLNKKKLTVGRVLTPTLGLVVLRDSLIEGHIKEKYYELYADVEVNACRTKEQYFPVIEEFGLSDERIVDHGPLDQVAGKISNKMFDHFVIKKSISEQPPLPFNLVKLQTYCGNTFKYSPKDVTRITQSLRDNYKAITYNRSDCQYLTEEHYEEAPEVIENVMKNIGDVEGIDVKRKSKCFNGENVNVHFAIIPTAESIDISSLTQEERNVYIAICKRYLIQFMEPAIKEKTELTAAVPKGALKATSYKIINPGFLGYYKGESGDDLLSEDEEETSLSNLQEGQYKGYIVSTKIEERETTPPKRYTKTSLNEDMTRIAKYVDDPEIKKLLLLKDKDKKAENGSIGTTATRDTIIENLIKYGYLEETKDKLISTALGREFYNILPAEIKKADMTAKWWVIQERIKDGEATPEDLTKEVLDIITKIINQEQKPVNVIPCEKAAIGKCKICGSPVIETQKAYSCSEWRNGCKFIIWKTVAGKTITLPQVEKLLKNGKTDLIKGFKKQTGESFDSRLILKNDKTIGFESKKK